MEGIVAHAFAEIDCIERFDNIFSAPYQECAHLVQDCTFSSQSLR